MMSPRLAIIEQMRAHTRVGKASHATPPHNTMVATSAAMPMMHAQAAFCPALQDTIAKSRNAHKAPRAEGDATYLPRAWYLRDNVEVEPCAVRSMWTRA